MSYSWYLANPDYGNYLALLMQEFQTLITLISVIAVLGGIIFGGWRVVHWWWGYINPQWIIGLRVDVSEDPSELGADGKSVIRVKLDGVFQGETRSYIAPKHLSAVDVAAGNTSLASPMMQMSSIATHNAVLGNLVMSFAYEIRRDAKREWLDIFLVHKCTAGSEENALRALAIAETIDLALFAADVPSSRYRFEGSDDADWLLPALREYARLRLQSVRTRNGKSAQHRYDLTGRRVIGRVESGRQANR